MYRTNVRAILASMTIRATDTRERILATALERVGTVGFEELSIGGLARATDMSKSGVFAHFGSKEALQVAVLGAARERWIDEVFQPALAHGRGESRLRALFSRWLDWEEGKVVPGGCPFLVASHEFDDRPGPVRDEVVRIQEQLSRALEKAFRLGIEEGHFRDDADPVQFGYELYGIILTFHLHFRLFRRPGARERADRAFEALLERAR